MGYTCANCNKEIKEGEEVVQINRQDGQGERVEIVHRRRCEYE